MATSATPEPTIKSIASDTLAKIEAAGEAELKAAAPELVALAQGLLTHIEANMGGITGTVEKTALNALFAAASKALLAAASA